MAMGGGRPRPRMGELKRGPGARACGTVFTRMAPRAQGCPTTNTPHLCEILGRSLAAPGPSTATPPMSQYGDPRAFRDAGAEGALVDAACSTARSAPALQ